MNNSENTQLSTNTLVILISKPQTQIYNISLKNEKFPKISVLRKLFKNSTY